MMFQTSLWCCLRPLAPEKRVTFARSARNEHPSESLSERPLGKEYLCLCSGAALGPPGAAGESAAPLRVAKALLRRASAPGSLHRDRFLFSIRCEYLLFAWAKKVGRAPFSSGAPGEGRRRQLLRHRVAARQGGAHALPRPGGAVL